MSDEFGAWIRDILHRYELDEYFRLHDELIVERRARTIAERRRARAMRTSSIGRESARYRQEESASDSMVGDA